jgi:hypothetical protein
MAHESFEDAGVAGVLNRDFVAVKVDREERPDVDSVYMGAVQALSGHGGWPMSVFLTPDGTPFFGGTYWPREERAGMPGFMRVLDAVSSAWTTQRDGVERSGQRVAAHLASGADLGAAPASVDLDVPGEAAALSVRAWDEVRGGFGGAPKFPQAMAIDFLLAHAVRTGDEGALRAATHTLHAIARGGIYDHVGGGFARYSVDADWLVPHFEKMLYDNALLLRAYVHGSQVAGEPHFARVARETADYLLAEMRHHGGGFFSSTDADSEGVEGKFFVWSHEEFSAVVAAAGEDPGEWAAVLGVTPGGNFEGASILHRPGPQPEVARYPEDHDAGFAERLATVRRALYERRSARVPPGLDDKVLTSWNGLVIGALAEAGAVLGERRYVGAAQRCASFLRAELVQDGRLLHTWRQGHGASVPAFLEDVAFLAQGLCVLYEADFDAAWLAWARELAADADTRFAERRDGEPAGAYFQTAEDAEPLVTRPMDLWDNATPSGASVMADVHLRLGALTGEAHHFERAERVLARFGDRAVRAPTGYGELLRAFERLAGGPREVAVAGPLGDPATTGLVDAYRRRWRPSTVLAAGPVDEPGVPLLAGRPLVDGRPAAYVCRSFACERPVTDPLELAGLLGDA